MDQVDKSSSASGLSIAAEIRMDEAAHGQRIRLALRQNDWNNALLHLAVMRQEFPSSAWAICQTISCSRRLQRYDEAETLANEAATWFPDNHDILVERARVAVGRQDFAEAALRFQDVVEKFPESWHGYGGHAEVSRKQGLFRQSEAILLVAADAVADGKWPLRMLALTLDHTTPMERTLSAEDLGRRIHLYIDEHGPSPELLEAYAHIARVEGDYKLFHDRIQAAAHKFPESEQIRTASVVSRELILGINSSDTPTVQVATTISGSVDPLSAIVSKCESLGGSGAYGCEFGFLQRSLGLEPLSLLRWSSLLPEHLGQALDEGFARLGLPASTVLRKTAASDWAYTDTEYKIYCDHTHLERSTVSEDQARKMLCNRMQYLSRKLREDLEDGDKLLVFRHDFLPQTEADILKLAASVNRYGRNTLFYVCRSNSECKALTVRQVHSGLIIGYIDEFAVDRPFKNSNIKGWTTLCALAHEMLERHNQVGA